MNKIIIILVVVLVVLVGGYFWVTGMDTSAPGEEADNNQENPIVNVEVESNAQKTTTTYEVVYTDSGFSPAALTIKAGDTVVFKNQSNSNMWVGSAMHPTHMVYSGTSLQQHCPDAEGDDFDACENRTPGNSWAFTFKKTGSWGYHNHSNSAHFGKVTVE